MPRKVDREQRRERIIAALIEVAVAEGLHAVTLRAVAEASGVSLGQVQHYFGSKAELMHAALEHLERQSRQRWAARLAGLPDPPPVRAFLTAFLAEALPDDVPSRTFHQLFTSYALLATTDPAFAEQPFVAGPDRLESELVAVLRRGRSTGEVAPDIDPVAEAARLIAVNHGLGTSVLIGQRTAAAAAAVQRYHLDRLLRPGPGEPPTT